MHLTVSEVNVTMNEDGSASSGNGNDLMNGIQTEFTYTFPEKEILGQLYAYRINNSAVVLRTRETFYLDQRIPIGISQVAKGEYTCTARNANEMDEVSVNIDIVGEYSGL